MSHLDGQQRVNAPFIPNIIQMAYFLNHLSKKLKKRTTGPLKLMEFCFGQKVLHGGQNHRHEKIGFFLNFTLHLTPPYKSHSNYTSIWSKLTWKGLQNNLKWTLKQPKMQIITLFCSKMQPYSLFHDKNMMHVFGNVYFTLFYHFRPVTAQNNKNWHKNWLMHDIRFLLHGRNKPLFSTIFI